MDSQRNHRHVIGPEMGITLPGTTLVCGDSHTSTHGALGALAFGIGTSEVEHVLASQTVWMKQPIPMEILMQGKRSNKHAVTAKDLILALIRKIGIAGGTGTVLEYRGDAIREMDMEGRMTICNMSIEAGARAGLVAPDETTLSISKEGSMHQKIGTRQYRNGASLNQMLGQNLKRVSHLMHRALHHK